jgi:LacI family transcriptional regulator
MLSKELQSPHIKALAERLMTDIRHRGLGVGDRYLTTEEVSQSLGVGKAAANKAMRFLAERGVLISRQRSGTFIGPGVDKRKRSKVRTIYVLLPAGDPSASHWSYHLFIAGIRNAIPGINVQFTFVPENDAVPYVRELIDSAQASGQFAGVVSVSCPPQVYRFLAELHVPAVVYGSLYSSDLRIASVDIDGREAGRLLTQYLIDRGHRRMALLVTGGGRPGDNAFFDGISGALAGAGLPHNALIQRLIRGDIETMRATARELLEEKGHPTAIITRGVIQANEVAGIAAELGLSIPEDLEIVFDHEDQTLPRIDMTTYPRVQPKLSFVEIAETIGKTVQDMAEGMSSRPRQITIPVELCLPERNKAKSD